MKKLIVLCCILIMVTGCIRYEGFWDLKPKETVWLETDNHDGKKGKEAPEHEKASAPGPGMIDGNNPPSVGYND